MQCAAFTKGSTCAQTTFAPAKNADGWCEITSKEVRLSVMQCFSPLRRPLTQYPHTVGSG